MANAKQKLPTHVLIQMRQGPEESLQTYFKRFQAMRLEINDPGSAVSIYTLVAGLQNNELADSLAKKLVANYEQLMAKAYGCMDMEDARDYKASARFVETSTSITSATTTIPIISSTLEIVPMVAPMPELARNYPARKEWPRDLLRDQDHLTNECRILKRDIKNLIERGYLKNFASRWDCREANSPRADKRPRSWLPHPQPQQDSRPPELCHKGVINTISDGLTIGGSSNNARKRYAKRALQVDQNSKRTKAEELISFGDADMQGVVTPHDDPIVISTAIDGYQKKQIMINTGSSVDILYVSTFNQMGIDKSRLLPYRGPLVGFTKHSLLPKGMITLLLIVGEYPRQAIFQVQFLVMDLKSAHNVILSRTALHLL
ncbi:uncharacterized protein LOC109821557 [Asparagus officinalis]|uniref:uncharacterized protein LOC109821557 n=1 Tax=Asparagus officinalis TaxID=4686 RepID=UPI00098E36C6|nr:uncharacterized protein LOC109821557 [Asparagus officinalis]